jgi:hypothetical protein
MPELIRWSDDRLDDLWREVQGLSDMREEIIRIDVRTSSGATTQAECLRKLEALELRMNLRDEQRLEERKAQAQERKADRRWLVLTLLTVAGLIIAALGIFLG